MEKPTAPKIDGYIGWLGRIEYMNFDNTFTFDELSYQIIDEIFSILRRIKPINDDEWRTLWIHADRGPIEDYGDYEEWLAEKMVKNRDEFNASWLRDYPTDMIWYSFSAVERKDTGYRAIFVGHKMVIEVDPKKKRGFENDISEFAQWILEAVTKSCEELKAGSYAQLAEARIPPEQRTGTITRKELWDIMPEEREEFRKSITDEEIEEFGSLVSAQGGKWDYDSVSRRSNFTANEFFRCCALGYAENEYEGTDLTPREQYRRHADGRDGGLCEIDPDSPEEFLEWLNSKEHFGSHPWEVCRGGNSTHVDCMVCHDEKGYLVTITGKSLWRCVEAVKFYLAIRRAGYPVFMHDAELLISRFRETELVGIVPDGIIPAYCQSMFPGEEVESFMNLPDEQRDEIAARAVWHPLEIAELLPEYENRQEE